MDPFPENLVSVVINSVILLFLSGVFSGAETAFTNLSPARLEIIRKEGKFASKLVYKLCQKLDLIISLSLILSNAVNMILATYLTIFFTGLFGVELGGLLSVTVGTVLVIVFGEIVPKKIAILYPVEFSRWTAHLLEFCRIVIFPVLIPILFLNKALDKIKKRTAGEQKIELQNEIIATLGIGHNQGALESQEYKMMNQLLLLNDKEVSEIMTHRSEIVAIKADSTLRELLTLVSEHNLSRVPVYEESIDDISYIIHTPQLNSHLIRKGNLERPVIDFCVQKAFKVPESKILDDLFFEFQKKRLHMAIVLNEFGETSGLITLEDIIEQIFGDIEDETDKKEENITKIDDNTFMVQGGVEIEDLEDLVGLKMPDDFPKHKSISWLILDILHRFPEEGETIMIPETNITLEVLDMDEEYIDKVLVKKV